MMKESSRQEAGVCRDFQEMRKFFTLIAIMLSTVDYKRNLLPKEIIEENRSN